MSKTKKKTDPVVVLLDLVIIALIFVMLIVGIEFYFNFSYEKRGGTFMQEAKEMAFDLERNNYASLIQGAYMNKINGKTDTAQYHELAEYTEAAFLYKVYEGKGKAAETAAQKEIMDRARQNMGSLTIFADRVDGLIRDFGKK
ncbi:MAG: hypothetical protein MJ114_06385 [Acetatifactor sp.]|nr:hypothetical protein [Acetatifactor sp.]